MTRWETMSVLVVGLGKSGQAAAHSLLRHGATVRAADAATTPAAEEAAAGLRAAGITVTLGTADAGIDGVTLVVPSPGVAPGAPVLQAAAAARVPVWSEPELAWDLNGGRTRVVGITGTNGKTTTTELTAACLGAPAAGNIGTPLVELLDAAEPPRLVVAELSSFQLAFTHGLRPAVAGLLNVAPDHLDWHGGLGPYRAAKARIWANQRDGDVTVLGIDDAGVRATAASHTPPAHVVEFTLAPPTTGQVGVVDGTVVAMVADIPAEIVATSDLGVAGPHNLANVCAAVALSVSAGADARDLAAPLRAYRAGRHRLEAVATVAGVSYVDDSKATNPHACAAALAAFPRGRVVWIAGGLGKGLTFETLTEPIRRHVHTAVTIGTSGPAIAAVARAAGVSVIEAGDLATAVPQAAKAARPGDTVLLAPACASMDQFADYAARGQAFRAAVARLQTPLEGAGRGR